MVRDLLGGVWAPRRWRRGWCVEQAGIAAEGAQDVGGGLVAVEEVHWGAVVAGVPDEQDHGALSSLEDVGAGLGEGLSWRLAVAQRGEGWGRGAVQDRAAARRQVVDESGAVGLRLRLGLGLLGG